MNRTTLLWTCGGLLLAGIAVNVRAEVGHAMSSESTAALLDRELDAVDAGLRLYAVKMLARLAAAEANPSEVVLRLERSAADSNPQVAAQARYELACLTGRPTTASASASEPDPSVVEEAEDLGAGLAMLDPGHRLHAVKALGRLARSREPASLAVTLLQAALGDRSLVVATQAEAELARIEGRSAIRAAPEADRSDIDDYAALYFSSSDVGERLRAVKRLAALAVPGRREAVIDRVLEAARADRHGGVSALARDVVDNLQSRNDASRP